MNLEELRKHSMKRELSEKDLDTKLMVVLSNIPDRACELLTTFNVRYVKDLLEIDFCDLVFEERKGNICDLRNIRKCCHKFGFVLNGEYDGLDISDEEALIPITALELNQRLQKCLLRSGKVFCLGDLLSLDLNTLRNIRGLGDKGYRELSDYLGSLGYKLEPMSESVEDKKQRLKENGETLIDELIDYRKVTFALNRAGIYSVDQLLAVDDIRSISGIGDAYCSVIFDGLRTFCLGQSKDEISTGNEDLDKLIEERNKLRGRKAALLLEQVEIDSKLSSINSSINKMSVGVSYDKKKN